MFHLDPGPGGPVLDLSAQSLQRLGNPTSCFLHLFYLQVTKSAIFPPIVQLLPLSNGTPHLLQEVHILQSIKQTINKLMHKNNIVIKFM